MRKIGYNELLTTLTEIVSKSPEYVYQWVWVGESSRCRYVDQGQPSCLIGHVLHHLGVSIEELEAFDMQEDTAAKDIDVWEDNKTEKLASLVQLEQDLGRTWEEALGYGIDKVEKWEKRNNEA